MARENDSNHHSIKEDSMTLQAGDSLYGLGVLIHPVNLHMFD